MIWEEIMATKNKKVRNINKKKEPDTKILNQFYNQTNKNWKTCLDIDTKP